MTKKKRTILIIVCILIVLWGYFIYRDQTRCYEIQNRCTPYDLSTVENIEYLDFYHWLNDKCMWKCWTAKLKLNLKKRWCRYQYKQHKEHTKDRRYISPDTYNPCPYLYTLLELNEWLKIDN